MKKLSFICLVCFITPLFKIYGQNKVMTFQEAENQGKPYAHLDSIYKSAVHSEIEGAVFKTSEEQEDFVSAYRDFIKSFASHLEAHDFQWEKPTRCFNRIYFDSDGTVDYFLYNFSEGQISPEKEKAFELLASTFINNYKFTLTADEKFAQCSPVQYK